MADTGYSREASLALLQELSEVVGISGAEDDVRRLILEKIKPLVKEWWVDGMGNLIAFKPGTGESPLKVLMAAHMDEVGFMVTDYDSSGFLGLKAVGGIDDKILPALRLLVGPKKLNGVMMWKPIHLSSSQEVQSLSSLRVDIGVSTKDAASAAAPLGTPVAFASRFDRLSPTVIRGKAFDDRAGCAEIIEHLQGPPLPFDLYAAFTVQEEVGLRGARILLNQIPADLALILEATACHEVPQDEDQPDQTTVTRLGAGGVISYMDASSIAHRGLFRHFVGVAKAEGIPYQFRSSQFAGGNDGGAVHISGAGIPTISLSLPCRYLHSPYSLISLADYEAALLLARAALSQLKPEDLLRTE